ncbi:MAG: carbamoyltransferase N-terminal domain-containing protein [Pseudonocardiaceae bacterium]
MIICGLKLTHDGGIALLEDEELLCSIEIEKLDNGLRYQPLDKLEVVEEVLLRHNYRLDDIDVFVVDGWFTAPGDSAPFLRISNRSIPVTVEVAPYCDEDSVSVPLQRYEFDGLPLGLGAFRYASYHHVTHHLLASYCTSPFAVRKEPSLVVVWDGGMVPRLYRVNVDPFTVTSLGSLFPVYGSIFADYAAQFDAFRKTPSGDLESTAIDHLMPRNLDVAGKAMAYAALGRDEPGFYQVFESKLDDLPFSFEAGIKLARWIDSNRDVVWPGCSDADLIASFQGYLGAKLLTCLRERVPQVVSDGNPPNLCLSGGCSLNIKWNSALRSSGLFREVWIPPFSNDSGAAIGTAVAEIVHRGKSKLQWDVYRGPSLAAVTDVPGWRFEKCDEAALAKVLHDTGEPVVVLSGRAELGPRALGNRSILAAATAPKMKDLLNNIKDRESYRPVAPICLESRAPEIFSPGSPDPYMLFDHTVRASWAERIPAVIHLDGTARLQTINSRQNIVVERVLVEYEKLSGIPVLCNTSANYKGRGFFPDVPSVARWGRVNAIWCDGHIYVRQS